MPSLILNIRFDIFQVGSLSNLTYIFLPAQKLREVFSASSLQSHLSERLSVQRNAEHLRLKSEVFRHLERENFQLSSIVDRASLSG